MQVPTGSSSATALLRAPQKMPERSQRGHWYTNEEEAVGLARDEQRPLLVDFAAQWCLACKELQKHTYPAIGEELHRFVLLRIDATNEDDPAVKQLLDRYKVLGLPAVLLIDGKGNEVQRIDKFIDADSMRDALRRVP